LKWKQTNKWKIVNFNPFLSKERNFQTPLSRVWRALLQPYPFKPAQLLSLKFQNPTNGYIYRSNLHRSKGGRITLLLCEFGETWHSSVAKEPTSIVNLTIYHKRWVKSSPKNLFRLTLIKPKTGNLTKILHHRLVN